MKMKTMQNFVLEKMSMTIFPLEVMRAHIRHNARHPIFEGARELEGNRGGEVR